MKLESQVCNLELAKRLKELGVKQDGAFSWCYNNGEHFLGFRHMHAEDITKPFGIASAFTVAELGEMLFRHEVSLKTWIEDEGDALPWHELDWSILAENNGVRYLQGSGLVFQKTSEADARAKMLIFLLENKHVEAIP